MNVRQLALLALFMALVAVATMIVRVPIPVTKGYMNLGDSLVLLSGIFFGPTLGFMAGGIGSSLADIFGGYPQWAPWTLGIKGIEAMLVGLAVRWLNLNTRRITLPVIACFLVCTGWMVLGYYVTEVIMYDQKAALAELPANLVQAGGSIILASLLLPLFSRIIRSSGQATS
ncbi:MAG TPA: ECF transporter S component [Deltaproteobacteria bacterium]|nr:ECF transporter S component [Deltaproteobacteria bacterium]HPR55326.1 ECF transporter S component [Deltaproteobacteria bacterium]HXK47452.1 ECF transporter S component [Deltaproteobacteria bacterium]